MASAPGTIRFGEVNSKPPAPPVNYALLYIKTDNVLYLQDSSGTEIPLGSASSITQLTGDVSAIGPGPAVATVNFVGGSSAALIHSAEILANAATSLNTFSTIVKRDASGNFTAGTITAALIGNASSATTTISFTGSLAGDVTGTQSATVVSSVGGSSAANVHSAELLANAATDLNTASTIVKRDGSGNFSAGTIIANLTGTATNATTSVNFTGSLSGDVTGTQSTTTIASAVVTSKLLTGLVPGTNTAILSTDSILVALEKLQAQVSGTTGTAITALTGDVSATGPGSSTATVNSVGGSSAANVHSAELAANAATSINTASTIVKRDASGNFSAGTITANITGNVSGTASNITGLLAIVNGGTNSAAALNNNRVMISSAGAIVEASAITPSRALVSNTNGIPVASVTTTTEIGFVSGVTSSIQTQINSISGSAITALTGDVTATGPGSVTATISAGAVTAAKLGTITDGITIDQAGSGGTLEVKTGGITNTQINGSAGIVYSKLSLANSIVNNDINASAAIAYSKLAALTTNRALQSDGSGFVSASVVTSIELGYVSGVTSSIQTQFAGKQPVGNYITATTGDVIATGPGSVVATIQPNVVTNAKLAQMSANTIKGNNTGVTANAMDLTTSQVNILLGTVTTVGSFNGQAASANGSAISGNSIFFQSASITNPGMVDNTIQSFSGNKTFTGTVAISISSLTALAINTTSFVFDSTDNALGIGIQPASNVFIDAVNSTAASKTLQLTGYGIGSTVGTRGRFARGTSVTPTAVQSGDIINFWSARGYGASQFAAASTAAINAVAGEAFTNTSNLTYLSFFTTPTGSVTSAESARISSTGTTLGPQTGSTALHQINGGLRVTRRTTTASFAVDTTTTDYLILCSHSSAITITLPAPTDGRVLVIKDISGTASTNNVTIARHASEKIEGLAANFNFQTNWGVLNIYSDGTDWYIN